MIGRAAIGYPWIFNEIKHFLKTGTHLPKPTINDRISVCKIHLQKSIEWKNPVLGILEMRRHYANYFKGLPHFKDYRMRLVTSNSYDDIMTILEEVQSNYSEIEVD